jgi:hypothetical protein
MAGQQKQRRFLAPGQKDRRACIDGPWAPADLPAPQGTGAALVLFARVARNEPHVRGALWQVLQSRLPSAFEAPTFGEGLSAALDCARATNHKCGHRRLTSVADLMTEVGRFRAWADATFRPDRRFREWECCYEEWEWYSLYGAVLEFFAAQPFESWSAEEVRAVLYAIARDNERQHLAGEVRRQYPDLLVPLTRASIEAGERDDRWQLAEELGRFGRAGGEEELLLLRLVR